jgi:hypothetical protein
MSTGAEIEVTNTNGKKYTFWVHADGYPEGIVCHLPDEPIDFEDFPGRCVLKISQNTHHTTMKSRSLTLR